MKKKIIILAAIALLLLCLSIAINKSIYGFVYWDGPYYGRVVDAETGEPLKGAAVAGIWKFEHCYFLSITSYATAKETTTDQDGKFEIPLTFAFTGYPISILKKMDLLIFKPGYDSSPPTIQRKIPKPDWIELSSPDGMYWVGKWEGCQIRKNCLIELHKALNLEEEEIVILKKMNFDDIPINQRYKMKSMIILVNQERQKFGAFSIPINHSRQ